jgi:hypothetical protein
MPLPDLLRAKLRLVHHGGGVAAVGNAVCN